MTGKVVVTAALWLAGAVVVTACKQEAAAPVAAVKTPAAVAVMQDGKQVVHITVKETGYVPDRVELRVGVPAQLIFKQEDKYECGSKVQIPSQGIGPTELPMGKETAVEFTPAAAGEFPFTCGMNMMKGTLIVKS